MRALRIPWAAFRTAAFPIIHDYVQRHQKSPTCTYVRNHGHGWMVSAAYSYYGGWPRTLRRLGFPPATRPMIQRPGHRRQGYWMRDNNILQELTVAFPDFVSWETMPSIHMIQDRLPGLASRILRVDSVRSTARRLGLQLYWTGQRHRRRVEGIDWALTFYEREDRWPIARECPSSVRSERFQRGLSWHDYCRPKGLPRSGVERLVKRFERHRVWLRLHRPEKVLVRQRVLNHLIIELAHRFPPLP